MVDTCKTGAFLCFLSGSLVGFCIGVIDLCQVWSLVPVNPVQYFSFTICTENFHTSNMVLGAVWNVLVSLLGCVV